MEDDEAFISDGSDSAVELIDSEEDEGEEDAYVASDVTDDGQDDGEDEGEDPQDVITAATRSHSSTSGGL